MSAVHLLTNPSATTKRRARADAGLRASLRARGHEIVELRPSSLDVIAPTITEARHAGVTRLIIAGGDGLLHRALPAIAGSDVPVGIVSVGTGNDFARALGLPTEIDEAVAAALTDANSIDLLSIQEGEPTPGAATSTAVKPGDERSGKRSRQAGSQPTDGDGWAGGWGASVVTGGFSGMVNERANRLRFPPGPHRYTVATLMELSALRDFGLTLAVDDVTHHLRATLFAIANTPYFGGGMAICPDADPTDGLVDVTVVGPTSKVELARVLPTVFSGKHVDHPSVTVYRGRRITLTTTAALWADGEPLRPTSAPDDPSVTSFTAEPGALRVAGTLVGT